uniref:Trafficking protein particle complex subunit 11 domain-containing protein n=1 Tax=Kwoniella pini CBS 10737 TaxID=1296096 RepID=A0A1B9ID46_9TREE|nr:uncharacterized protein I206_00759 [Kwoniella pini CBS 10737]OCF53456.1 hypothetical protein I206_00759 [Kwoniella pini CBS 10737]
MPRPVTITYTLHPSYTSPSSSNQTNQILNLAIQGIKQHLPLRNLHWKSSTRTSLRTIQEIDIELIELGEISSTTNNNKFNLGNESSILDNPLVNLCLVVCEDAEIYKNQTRNFIRDWLSLLAARRTPHAPLIVLVNPPNQSGGSNSGSKNVWGKDKGVLGKIKNDFNVGKRDRCIQLNLPRESSGLNDPAIWPELINKLKESLISAFDSLIIEREEEVKRGESQRLNIGWNFCTWFLLKESLANSFEAVNLPEDSLIIYEELEASFFQVLKEQNLSWFGISKLGAMNFGDDSLPILDVSQKPYRELIRNSQISIFDFRIYLFARQGQLLGKLGRITEVAKRGQWFVASLTRRLREAENSLAEHFIESWTYTACMDIVSRCDQWSRIDRPNGDYSGLVAYESARSELLDIARIQVERIGVSSGHLPPIYPFNPATSPYPKLSEEEDVLFETTSNGLSDDEELQHTPSNNQGSPTERPELSNEQLIDAQKDQNNCRSLYLGLTQKTIKAYGSCGKVNSVIRLKADLAALALYTENWVEAYDLSRALARDCAELLTWDPISKFALEGALQAHRELDKEKDEDWENLALAYLRVCALVIDEKATDQQDEDQYQELRKVVDGLKETDNEQEVEGHKAFNVRLISEAVRHEVGGSLTSVQVEVNNILPICVDADGISIDLADSDGEIITFSSDGKTLQPGTNAMKASCSTSTQGLYTLHSATIVLGSISFTYDKFNEGQTLRVKLKLDEDPKVVVEVRSGIVDMKNIKIGLRSLIPEVRYLLQDAEFDERLVSLDESGLILFSDIQSGGEVVISIPYAGVPQGEYAKAQITIQYDTSSSSRDWIDSQVVFMGLPLTVNVQDFFRPDCLLSHFTVASDGREYLRIASVELTPPEGGAYEVQASRKKWDDTITVHPNQPLSCLFKVKQLHKDDQGAVLRLKIRYRSLEEVEVRHAIEYAFRQLSPAARDKIRNITREWMNDKAKWLEPYLLGISLAQTLGEIFESQNIDGLESVLKDENKIWRTLEIPVDVPQHRLLTIIRMNPTTPLNQIYEGRAINMKLSLTTSFSWCGQIIKNENEKKMLVFDIQNNEDWLIVGKKKGYYMANPNEIEEQDIILIPMKSGQLFLPTINIDLLSNIIPNQIQIQNQNNSRSGLISNENEILCETYFENSGESIIVLPCKKEINHFLPILIPNGEAWESERI